MFAVVPASDPAQALAATDLIAAQGRHALILRGLEGEPVADPRRQQAMDVYLHGRHRPDLSIEAQEGAPTALPVLPRAIDAASTAHYIQSVVSGEMPAPAPLLRQVDCIGTALTALRTGAVDNRDTWSVSMR
jgi:anthranilate phosphoribosyltransferase